jgi:hypothetical protein
MIENQWLLCLQTINNFQQVDFLQYNVINATDYECWLPITVSACNLSKPTSNTSLILHEVFYNTL